MTKYHTDSYGASQNALGTAFTKLLQLGAQTGRAALAVHQLSNLTGILSDILQPGQIAALSGSNRRVTLNGVTVFLVTERNPAAGFTRGPLLAAHVNPAFLKKLSDSPSYTDVIYVPWSEGERASYIAAHASESTEIPFDKEAYLTTVEE